MQSHQAQELWPKDVCWEIAERESRRGWGLGVMLGMALAPWLELPFVLGEPGRIGSGICAQCHG